MRRASISDNATFLLVFLFVAISLFYSGIHRSGEAKNIDAMFFYAAAKCWTAGMSPYDPQTFRQTYVSLFQGEPEAPFVAYLPTLVVVVWPMGLLGWKAAALYLSLVNYLAAMVIFFTSFRLLQIYLDRQPRYQEWLWLLLGSTIGGISGTIFTGQTSVFVTAACVVTVFGYLRNIRWLIVAGVVMASAKPHLSGPLLFILMLFEKRQIASTLSALLAVLVILAFAQWADGHLLSHYLGSINSYNSLAANAPVEQAGFVALLLRIGVSKGLADLSGVLLLTGLLSIASYVIVKANKPPSSLPMPLILLFLCTGVARSLQAYDLCYFAVALALMATLPLRLQFGLFIPALLIWRPSLFLPKGAEAAALNVVGAVGWLCLLAVVAALAIGKAATRRAATLAPDVSAP